MSQTTMRSAGVLGGIVCVVLMMFLPAGAVPRAPAKAHGGAGNGGLLHVPSAASLAHCRTKCGGVKFAYPFGIGPGCFRQGFELRCDHTTHPHRLFLGNTTTQVNDINLVEDYVPLVSTPAIVFNITMSPGGDTYYNTWEAPVNGVFIDSNHALYVIGCGVSVSLFHHNTTDPIGSCTSICYDDREIMNEAYNTSMELCNGIGCCTIGLPKMSLQAFRFKLDHIDGTIAQSNLPLPYAKVILSQSSYRSSFSLSDLYSSWVNASHLLPVVLMIPIIDQPSCRSAQMNKGSYACNNESECWDSSSGGGYFCFCHHAREDGNPYVLDGCTQAYIPLGEENCTKSCGSMTIPFPFGIEERCSANENFQLNCTPNNITILDRGYAQYRVTNFSIDDGTLSVSNMLNDTNSMEMLIVNTTRFDYSDLMDDVFDFSEEDEIIIKWAVANLTCEKARLRNSTYACLSQKSDCLNVITRGKTHLGYRCKCSNGFQGNPYLQNNCTG